MNKASEISQVVIRKFGVVKNLNFERKGNYMCFF